MVQSLDLVVTRRWEHVAIIGRIASRADQVLRCNLCQSRSTRLGGVHCGEVQIHRINGHFFIESEPVTGIWGFEKLDRAAG